MSTLISDLRQAGRSLSKDRGFLTTALMTIALGVGANTAVFSIVKAVLIEPLPYGDSGRLVALHETVADAPGERYQISYANFLDWQRRARSFESMAAFSDYAFTVAVGDVLERVAGPAVSWNYFDVLGIRPQVGRSFLPADDQPTAARVVILSDTLWERAFGRDPAAIGRSILLDGNSYSVVGVMAPAFTSPPDLRGLSDEARLWVPLARFASAGMRDNRSFSFINPVFARLRPGVTTEQAAAEMRAISIGLEREFPEHNRARGVDIVSLDDMFFGRVRGLLLVLFGAVGFVLLIACVNVMSLLGVRGAARQRELALRTALGAERGRLVGMLLTESLLLALGGGTLGLLLASWLIDALLALSPVTFPSFVRVGPDGTVLVFTLVVCIFAAALCGIVPSLTASRFDLVSALGAGGRLSTRTGSTWLRGGLVAVEIALAVVLLIGAGLMLRTLARLTTVDPGFRPHGLVTARVWLPREDLTGRAATAQLSGFGRGLLERVRMLPTVTEASISWDVPLSSRAGQTSVRLEEGTESVRARRHVVSPGHFRTIGIPILAGRDFTDDEARPDGRRVAIVSQRLLDRSDRRSHSGDGLGLLREGDRVHDIVGVVADVQHLRLLEPGTVEPDVYFPFDQFPTREFAVVTRVNGAAQPVVDGVRQIVNELNSGAPVYDVLTGTAMFAQQVTRERFTAALLAVFALVALTLTLVGIYGVVAYTVSQQRREFGIRLALGALPAAVLALVLRGALRIVLFGLAGGTLAAFGLTRLLQSLIYGVTSTDPATFAVVLTGLGLTGAIASIVPASRAMRIDPVSTLRAE